MTQPLIIILILNTNRCKDTIECLSSLKQNIYENQIVIVLDNLSKDGSSDAIRSTFPSVRLIQLDKNRGYAGNNNVGIKAALDLSADWVLILNEDIIVAPNFLTHLISIGESDPRIGILGPLVYHYDEPNVIQSAGGRLNKNWIPTHNGQNEIDCGRFKKPVEVDWISGCAIMVRRAVIDQIGMLDERFFYYWEETELCLRACKQGWRIMHVPGAKIWHKGVQRDYHPNPNTTYYNTRNRFLMLSKHKAPLTAWIVAWLQILRTLMSWSIRPKWRSMYEHRNAMVQGVLDFLNQRWGALS